METDAAGHLCTMVAVTAGSRPVYERHLPDSPWNESDPNVRRFGLQTYLGMRVPLGEADTSTLAVVWTEDRELAEDEIETFGILGRALAIEEERHGSQQILHRNQEAMVRFQKMDAIGQLAAGIAHEINTPIQFVGDNLRFLAETQTDLLAVAQAAAADPGLGSAVRRAIERADLAYLVEELPKAARQGQEGVERVSRIVKAMREMSHPGSGALAAADLNAAITTSATVAVNEYKYVADLVLDLAEGLPPVVCDGGAIRQVVLNLIVNAAHAIGDVIRDRHGGRGTITVTTRLAADGQGVEVAIADTGTGIPPAIRSRIFDPFFTTKEVGKGTGQGLAIVHNVVVNQHHGRIDLDTEVGRGTTFRLHLPLTPPQPEAPASASGSGSGRLPVPSEARS